MKIRIKSVVLWTALLAAAAPAAFGQYLWIDDKGVKQLSDRPPPPSVPVKRILKAPGKPLFNPNAETPQSDAGARDATGASVDGAVQGTQPGAKAPPTLAERNADFNQRRADRAADAKKAAAEAEQKAAVAANCDAARQNQRTLDQGIRIGTVDQNGERGVMNDLERAEFGKKNQKVLAGCQ
jgi:hypothetical protein